MDIKELYAVIEALTAFFLDHGITTMEEFESLDEEAGPELHEGFKGGILGVFYVALELMDELTDEILP